MRDIEYYKKFIGCLVTAKDNVNHSQKISEKFIDKFGILLSFEYVVDEYGCEVLSYNIWFDGKVDNYGTFQEVFERIFTIIEQ